ncbi:hypothetical protein TSOC111612_21575 [Tsukamurella ocularis]
MPASVVMSSRVTAGPSARPTVTVTDRSARGSGSVNCSHWLIAWSRPDETHAVFLSPSTAAAVPAPGSTVPSCVASAAELDAETVAPCQVPSTRPAAG